MFKWNEEEWFQQKLQEQINKYQAEIDSLRKTLEENCLALMTIKHSKERFLNSKGEYSEVLKTWEKELDYIFNIASVYCKE